MSLESAILEWLPQWYGAHREPGARDALMEVLSALVKERMGIHVRLRVREAFNAQGVEVPVEERRAIDRIVAGVMETDAGSVLQDSWMTIEQSFDALFPRRLIRDGEPLPEVLRVNASTVAVSVASEVDRLCGVLTAGCTRGLF
jgi:hypothetical protein